MKAFYGRIGQRLPDRQGYACFHFEHTSGALLELIIKFGRPLPREHQLVIATGNLTGPGILSASEVNPDSDFADKDPRMFGD